MTRSIHEHQWVYLGDLALTVTGKETDVSLRRLEICIECAMPRVQFGDKWHVMQPEATKKFLEQFDGEVAGFCIETSPSKEFQISVPHRRKKHRRLGRSLAEILKSARPVVLPGGKRG